MPEIKFFLITWN